MSATTEGGMFVRSVLAEVHAERVRQDAKWGEQNHPDVGQARTQTPDGVAEYHEVPNANRAKWLTDTRARNGVVSFADIAVEELCEAIEAAALGDEDAVRTEVIQLAAVCVQWAQAIDRRGGAEAASERALTKLREALGDDSRLAHDIRDGRLPLRQPQSGDRP